MKKSWFVFIVIFFTLLLLGIGLYFFFPSLTKTDNTPNTVPSFFGNLFENTPSNNQNNNPLDTDTNRNTSPTDEEEVVEELIGYQALKIGDYSVASLQPLDFKTSTTSTTTLVVSVGRGSGVVRVYDPQTKVTSIVGTISIPNIIRSEFTSNTIYTVVQSQEKDELRTFVLKSTPRTPIEERFFSPIFSSSNIDSFFIEENTIYFIEKTKSGAELYEYIPSTNKKTLIYRGLFSDIYGFSRKGSIFFGTKPASGTQGFLFTLDTKNTMVQKTYSGLALVGVPNQNGDTILVSTYFGNNSQTQLLNLTTKETIPLSIQTLKEKCVPDFSTKTFMFCAGSNNLPENTPDAWYMGKVSLNDTLYLIDSKSGSYDILTSTDEQIDVISPKSSRYSGIFTFINKIDSSPWVIMSR